MLMANVEQLPIAMIGAGSWGTALALYLGRRGQTVRLWSHDASHVAAMQREHCNQQYLPGHTFPPTLHVYSSLADAVAGIRDIMIAVPSAAFAPILTQLKPYLATDSRIVWVTKGLDPQTGKLLDEVAQDILGQEHAYAVLAGPSFAAEVAKGLPTAIVASSHDEQFNKDLVARFNSPLLRVYSSNDVIGVEVGGIVKNVLAIATGISDGMAFGANARSALITRGLAEIIRLGIALGGRAETFNGLTGIGDLVLTCTDDQSRNRRFGLAIGRGEVTNQAERKIGQVIEGKNNARLVLQLAKLYQVDMPITTAVWEILQGALTPAEAMQALLSREPKEE